MQPVSRIVERPVCYLIALAKVDIIVCYCLFCTLRIAVIRFICHGADHYILRIICQRCPVPCFTVIKILCAVFIHRHRLYVQSVPSKVETSIRYLITLAKVDVIVCLRLLRPLRVTIIRFMGHRSHHHIFRIISGARPVAGHSVCEFFRAVFIDSHRLHMRAVTCKVETSISYLITFTKVYVIICLTLFRALRIAVIRFMGHRSHHRILRIIRITGAVTRLTVNKLFCTVFVHRHRLYVQPIPSEVETSIRDLIALAEMNIIICLCLFFPLFITVIRFACHSAHHHVFRIIRLTGPVA